MGSEMCIRDSGYFEHDNEHVVALQEMASTVRQGGWFVLDFLHAPTVRSTLVPGPRSVGPGSTGERRLSRDGRFVCKIVKLADGRRLEERVRLFAPGELEAATLQLAERLRAAPPIALASAKQAVYLSGDADLDEMLRYETEAQLRCFASEDGHEGVRAFFERRDPHFTGH